MQLDDDVSADGVLASQCRSIDRTEYKERAGFQVAGADQACAAQRQARAGRRGDDGRRQGP